MSRAMTAYDYPAILDPTPEIEAAVRIFQRAYERYYASPDGSEEEQAASDARWEAHFALERALPTGAYFLIDGLLWGWAKRTNRGGLMIVHEPTRSTWPRREEIP